VGGVKLLLCGVKDLGGKDRILWLAWMAGTTRETGMKVPALVEKSARQKRKLELYVVRPQPMGKIASSLRPETPGKGPAWEEKSFSGGKALVRAACSMEKATSLDRADSKKKLGRKGAVVSKRFRRADTTAYSRFKARIGCLGTEYIP